MRLRTGSGVWRSCGRAGQEDSRANGSSYGEGEMIGNASFRGSASVAAAVLLGIGASVAPSVASAAGRVALVVGNGAYAEIGTLPNPGNDAADVAEALGRLGFEVETVRDADRAGMNAALRGFTRRSVGADVALVFYAGHGLEMDGVNYLVPVDARLERDTDVRFEAVALDDVLASVEGAALRVVILDACRNNPLARSMQLTSASRSVSRGSFGELNEDLLGAETLVAYAAAAGTTAADGRGRNSPYTAALLSFLEQPLELSALFRRVRGQVLDATSGAQRPHEYGSLLGEHYLGGASGPGTVTVVDSASNPALAQQETVFWESIRDSSNPAEFEAYLRQFPAGVFRALATVRLAALRGAVADAPSVDRRRAPGTVFRDCPTCPEMVVVPAGRFRMGCVSGRDCRDEERPVHEVQVPSFALGAYEVTFEEYEHFARATGRDRPNDRGWGRGGRPVINVSWEDAQAYVAWLSDETSDDYRLPSESEWEYAARAGTTTRYSWGQDIGRNRANCGGCGSRWDGDETAPAGSFAPNAWGLHDMHGNVNEWVEDCRHENYARGPRDGTAWTSGGSCDRRGLRGGSWRDGDLRAAKRGWNSRGYRSHSLGLRVARTLD
ncbi:MAG: SUMF1/EgtB/PvdO family nonheme iron enzyme [Acidobacteria bacterium]|nr:SUMF1/EgtB/PvdO family nonheme iron enzyme [Acidobacteriota bacterium]